MPATILRFFLILMLAPCGFGILPQVRADDYVGRTICAECHRQQSEAWQGSHHDLAMQEAGPETVLGDFDDAVFENFGLTTTFFRRDGHFMVRTDGPDGELDDFVISHTFGVYPLQQYLVEFSGGRLQVLDIAWDSRPKSEGGERWFHLHPEDPVPHDDVLHWTGPNLNWNYGCADCHSTNLKKNYDQATDSYHTTWSEIDVSCEACHGPGSAHVAWARSGQKADNPGPGDLGLGVRFDERKGVSWSTDSATGKPRRSVANNARTEINTCARCHGRRSQLSDAFVPGNAFLDAHRPSLLSAGLYFPDGQIQDEVYVWGSFLQSRMHQAGVTCSDCHDPHSTRLRLPEDGVCLQCHEAKQYTVASHHFHETGSDGARCVACHMPERTYMQVDARRDHSMRVPRPDLSVQLGTPNACNQCHTDQTAQWAAEHLQAWLGRLPRGLQDYAATLHAARAALPGSDRHLVALATDETQPVIARATALSALRAYPGPGALAAIQQALNSPEALERLGALDALASMGPRQRVIAFSALWDDRRAVRIEAARLLAGLPPAGVPEQAREKLDAVLDEYIETQLFSAERPEAQVNLAAVYADRGRFQAAEQAYQAALRLQPRFVPAYVNYAQLLAGREREGEADSLLRTGLDAVPENADIEHALGLSLVRQQRLADGLPYLARAASHAPDNARYSYVHAVALHSSGRARKAISVLQSALDRHPQNLELLYGLVSYNREIGQRQQALVHARRLLEIQPGNPELEQLIRELEAE